MISNFGGDLIIDRLAQFGYQAFYVGGCVRNRLLNEKIIDYDITTSALPEKVKDIFSDFPIFTAGIKHGTVSVVICGVVYEITTMRKEGEYNDFRHPEKIEFCADIHQDLTRRDFTINAIAFNKNQGIIDDFGGIYDTHNRLLRCVGNAKLRFYEDPLRILRGLRLASVYGLKIHKDTSVAIFEHAVLLKQISKERLFCELKSLLLGKNVYRVLQKYYQVIFELFNKSYYSNLTSDNLKVYFRAISYAKNLVQALAIFLFPIKNFASEALLQLKCDNKTLKAVLLILNRLEDKINVNPTNIKRILNKSVGIEEDLFVCRLALEKAKKYFNISNDYSIAKNSLTLVKKIISTNECYKLCQLKINGDDLKALGYEGKIIKDKLAYLLDMVIDEKINNDKKELLLFLNKNG